MIKENCSSINYNFIDLFAGAGGLSEGFVQAGFSPIAHVEKDNYACETLITRAAYYYLKQTGNIEIYYNYLSGKITKEKFLHFIPKHISQTIICETMSDETLSNIYKKIDGIMKLQNLKNIDVVVGGPPCQSYSLVGRAQSARMNIPMSEDPRNSLYKLYAKFLAKYQPKMFVFENVIGIKSANNGMIWQSLKKELENVGYEIDSKIQNARNFGVLQNRRRVIIIGWIKDSDLAYPNFKEQISASLINDLFNDLPKLKPGKSDSLYKMVKPSSYVVDNRIRTPEDVLTHHQSRPNIDRDIEIYKIAISLWDDENKRLNYNDLPEELKTHKNRKSFVDRFKVVGGDLPYCHTILAHLSKDGHYFIHPDINQHRSITVREAARIQSFPDNYFFEGPRTSQFVQVGNAVPPMMAKTIAMNIADELNKG